MEETTDPLFFIDTNILVYAYDSDEMEKHVVAKNLIKKCWDREILYAVSSKVLSELFVTLTKKLKGKISLDESEQIVKDIFAFTNFVKLPMDSKTILKAIELHKMSKCHYYDSLIAATMQLNNVVHIYTENIKDFSKITGIKVVNPFEKKKVSTKNQ